MKAVAFLLAALPTAAAAELTLTLPGTNPVERFTIRYACDSLEPFDVEYVNSGPTSLAIVPVEGERRVFAGVIAGSGARYAAGPYVWWTKGRSADLYDVRQDEDSAPIASCSETDG